MVDLLKLIRNRTFSKWILSCLIIVLVPTVITGILFFRKNTEAVSRQVIETNCDEGEKISRMVDEKLAEIKKLGVQLSCSPLISRIIDKYNVNGTDMEYIDYTNMLGEFRNYMAISDSIADMSILFPAYRSVLSSYGQDDFDSFFKYTNRFTGGSAPQIIGAAKQYNYFNVMKADNVSIYNKERSVIPVIQSLGYSVSVPRASLLVLIDKNRLGRLVKDMKTDQAASFIIVDNENFTMLGDDSIQLEDKPVYESLLKMQEDENVIKNGDTFIYVVKSKITSWKFLYIFPKGGISLGIKDIAKYISISAVLAFLLGFAISALFTYKNYNPLYRLYLNATKFGVVHVEKNGNEFEIIESSLNNLAREKNSAEDKIRCYEPIIRKNLLDSLIKGYFKDDSECRRLLTDAGFTVDENCLFGIVVMGLLDDIHQVDDKLLNEDMYTSLKLLYAADEYLKRENIAFEVFESKDGKVTAIMCFKNRGMNCAAEELKRLVNDMKRMYEGMFECPVFIAAGDICTSVPDISKSYMKAEKLLEWILITGSDSSADLEDFTMNTSSFYFFPNDWEVQITNCLKSGNYKSVSKIVKEIKYENNVNRSLSLGTMKRLIIQVIETGMKVIDECGLDSLRDEAGYRRAVRYYSLPDAWEYIDRLYSAICSGALSLRGSGNSALIEGIVRYVDENYFSCDISLKDISERFKVHFSSVSVLFKEGTGYNLHDYINRNRVNKAIALMRSTDNEICNISRAVGYDNYTTFSRIFIKYKGISPAVFRKTMGENRLEKSEHLGRSMINP